MSTKIKDFRTTTPKDVQVGDQVQFIDVPYFKDDLRVSFYLDTVVAINPTKSGKRVRVVFERNGEWPLLGWNTPFNTDPESFWERITTERGWKK